MLEESTEQPAKKVRGPGKVSATAKENIIAVFNRLEGTAGMAKWAARHQTEFYKIYSRLIPIDANLTGELAAQLTVKFVEPKTNGLANGHANGHDVPKITFSGN
jgi:hypothetical protein